MAEQRQPRKADKTSPKQANKPKFERNLLPAELRHATCIAKLGFDDKSWAQKRGRKTLFRAHMVKEGEQLAGMGHTMEDIASFWGVHKRTVERWANRHPEFRRALKDGRIRADAAVESSLYRRAQGYRFTEVHWKEYVIPAGKRAGEVVRYKDKEVIKEVPPDVTACIFWLKNRRPALWRDDRQLGFFDDEGAPLPLRYVIVPPKEPKQLPPSTKDKEAKPPNETKRRNH